jgi:aryl-alcohol dehydrogenase-like predicted oxidoreductase
MSMRLRPFGRTGLMISPFTLGSMEFGSKVNPTEASRMLDRAIEAGVIALDRQTSMPRAGARKLWGA